VEWTGRKVDQNISRTVGRVSAVRASVCIRFTPLEIPGFYQSVIVSSVVVGTSYEPEQLLRYNYSNGVNPSESEVVSSVPAPLDVVAGDVSWQLMGLIDAVFQIDNSMTIGIINTHAMLHKWHSLFAAT